MRSSSRSSLHALASAALLTGVMALVAEPAAAGGLRIAPSQIEARVQDGTTLPPVVLTNTGDGPLRVIVSARPAGQALSGLPTYDGSPAAPGSAWPHVEVRPSTLTIPAGGRRTVTATARGRDARAGRYGVLLFTAAPATGAAGDPTVASAVRLATNVLLRFPGEVTTTGAVTDARAEQGPEPRTLRIIARMHNGGNLHTRAPGTLTLRDARGEVIRVKDLRSEIVLPGKSRETWITVRRLLPAGVYRGEVDARVGGTPSRRSFTFRLVGPNELPTPALEVTRLEPADVEAGRPYDVKMTIRNTGTAPLRPGAMLGVRQSQGGAMLRRRGVDLPAIAPGESVERSVEMPPVERGTYELDLRLRDRGRVLDEARATFDTDLRTSWWDRLRDWLASHVGLVLALAAALALAGLAFGLWIGARSRARLRAAGPPDAAPAPAPAPAPERTEDLVAPR